MDRSSWSEIPVVSIECLKGSSKGEEWNGDSLQSGDIVEQVVIGGVSELRAPFKGGKASVMKSLHLAYKRNETAIAIRARRPGRAEKIDMQACLVPNEQAGKKQYMLRSLADPNHAVGFVDRVEADCIDLQATKSSRVETALNKAQLKDGYVSYPWEKMMREHLPIRNSSCFLSLLILPGLPDRSTNLYNDLEDTLGRTNTWLASAQASGVPIIFMNVQTESLLTKISGEKASSTVTASGLSELSNVANAGLYGFEDYHGVDIGVVRAVRLWYTPISGECELELVLKEGDNKLGFAISRTQEGFIFISSVNEMDGDHESAAQRAGLNSLYSLALEARKLLIVSRVSNEKVLPWMVSSSGAIRCFDTVSLSQKLSLHRHALKPILLHVFLWNRSLANQTVMSGVGRRASQLPPLPHSSLDVARLSVHSNPAGFLHSNAGSVSSNHSNASSDDSGSTSASAKQSKDNGEFAFKHQQDFAFANNWI